MVAWGRKLWVARLSDKHSPGGEGLQTKRGRTKGATALRRSLKPNLVANPQAKRQADVVRNVVANVIVEVHIFNVVP